MSFVAAFSKVLPGRPNSSSGSTGQPALQPSHRFQPHPRSKSPMPFHKPISNTPNKHPTHSKEDRFSRAFSNISLGFVESLRGSGSRRPRTAPASSANTTLIEKSEKGSYALYRYDEEEDGDYEEEVRTPSGLGSPLSPGAFKTEIIPKRRPSACSSISSASSLTSLIEIRPPSGLGTIKISTTNPTNSVETLPTTAQAQLLPKSTYPNFYLDTAFKGAAKKSCVDLNVGALQVQSDRLRDSPSPEIASLSAYLCNVLPILAPYLSNSTLQSLTLVNRSVTKQARKLHWQNLSLRINVASERISINLNSPSSILPEVGPLELVEQLNLRCNFNSTSPLNATLPRASTSSSPRTRPPPLILVPKTPKTTRTGETIIIQSEADSSNTVSTNATNGIVVPSSLSSLSRIKKRTSSLFLGLGKRVSFSARQAAGVSDAANVNDTLTSTKKAATSSTLSLAEGESPLSTPALMPARRESPFQNQKDALRRLTSTPTPSSSRRNTPTPTLPVAFHLPSRLGSTPASASSGSGWVPPAEWERAMPSPTSIAGPVVLFEQRERPPAGGKRLSRHTPGFPSLQIQIPSVTGAIVQKLAKGSGRNRSVSVSTRASANVSGEESALSLRRVSSSVPSLRAVALYPNPPLAANLAPRLSLPLLESIELASSSGISGLLASPPTLDSSSGGFDFRSPITGTHPSTPYTPYTPYSAISLSAFPLPPPLSSGTERTSVGSAGADTGSGAEFFESCMNGVVKFEKEREKERETMKMEAEVEAEAKMEVSQEVKRVFLGLINVERIKLEYVLDFSMDKPLLLQRFNRTLAPLLHALPALEKLSITFVSLSHPELEAALKEQWVQLAKECEMKFLQVDVVQA